MPALAGNHSEEDCLVLAANIRIVLTAMVERMEEAVKDGKELDAAVSKLLEMEERRKQPKLKQASRNSIMRQRVVNEKAPIVSSY